MKVALGSATSCSSVTMWCDYLQPDNLDELVFLT